MLKTGFILLANTAERVHAHPYAVIGPTCSKHTGLNVLNQTHASDYAQTEGLSSCSFMRCEAQEEEHEGCKVPHKCRTWAALMTIHLEKTMPSCFAPGTALLRGR